MLAEDMLRLDRLGQHSAQIGNFSMTWANIDQIGRICQNLTKIHQPVRFRHCFRPPQSSRQHLRVLCGLWGVGANSCTLRAPTLTLLRVCFSGGCEERSSLLCRHMYRMCVLRTHLSSAGRPGGVAAGLAEQVDRQLLAIVGLRRLHLAVLHEVARAALEGDLDRRHQRARHPHHEGRLPPQHRGLRTAGSVPKFRDVGAPLVPIASALPN